MVNNKKNPMVNDNIWDVSFLINEYPIIIGSNGRTHGDNTDATPATKEIKGPISILFP